MKVDMSLKDHLKEFAKECLLFQSPEAIKLVVWRIDMALFRIALTRFG
jgi:hypothetical protein